MTDTGGCPRFRRDRDRSLGEYNSGTMIQPLLASGILLRMRWQFDMMASAVRGEEAVSSDIARLVPRPGVENTQKSKRAQISTFCINFGTLLPLR